MSKTFIINPGIAFFGLLDSITGHSPERLAPYLLKDSFDPKVADIKKRVCLVPVCVQKINEVNQAKCNFHQTDYLNNKKL